LAVAVIALGALFATPGWRASTLVRIGADQPLAPLARAADPAFVLVPPGAAYDGADAYLVARDPIALGPGRGLGDDTPSAYAQPAYGWLAALLSLGRARIIPQMLIAVNVACFVLAAYLAALLARALGVSEWWSALVFLNPGFIFALTAGTAEPLLIAAGLLGLLLWPGRPRPAGAALALACFAGQAGLLLPPALALWEVAGPRPTGRAGSDGGSGGQERPARDRRALSLRLAVLALGPLLYGLWWLYLRARLGVWPLSHHVYLALPPAGLVKAIALSVHLTSGNFSQVETGNGMMPLILVAPVILVAGIVRSWRLRNPYQAIALLLALATLAVSGPDLLDPRSFFRTFAVPLTFVAFAFLATSSEPSRDRSNAPPAADRTPP